MRRDRIVGMADDWRNLRVGDVVRIVKMPSGVDAPGYTFHADTRRLYKRLIARRRPVRVCQIWGGMPWIHCRFRRNDGRWEYHSLAIADDSWVRVRKRRRKGRKS